MVWTWGDRYERYSTATMPGSTGLLVSVTRSGEREGEPGEESLATRWRSIDRDLAETLQAVRVAQAHPDLPPDLRELLVRAAAGLERAIGGLADLRGRTRQPPVGQAMSQTEPGRAHTGARTGVGPGGTPPVLSPREQDVLLLLAEGLSNRGIADRLGVGTATAKSHVQRLLAKLHATNRTQAVMEATRLGLLDPPG